MSDLNEKIKQLDEVMQRIAKAPMFKKALMAEQASKLSLECLHSMAYSIDVLAEQVASLEHEKTLEAGVR